MRTNRASQELAEREFYGRVRLPGPRWRRVTLTRVWLMLSICFAAFAASPAAFFGAAWWRLCGKRLRARSRFAPLLGAAPEAYRLWIERFEITPVSSAADVSVPTIVVAVDLTAGADGLDETLRSLTTEGVTALIVDPRAGSTLTDAARSIDWTAETWLMPLTAGDVLASGAVTAYRAAIVQAQGRIIYADDDLIDREGRRTSPHFKPDWNSELFRHFDFLSSSCIIQVEERTFEDLGGAGDWARELVASALNEGAPLHLRQVLHHRRIRQRPHVPAVPARTSADDLPSISVIVPTRNRVDLLANCLAGVAEVEYPDVEVIVVDNDSDDADALAFLERLNQTHCRVLRHVGPFNFSAINNRAAAGARGHLLCLLNNDVEMIERDWLATMVTNALRPDVGAVGARLLYPDGRVQHAGVVLGIGGAAAHAHRLLRPEDEGYFRRHNLPQFVSAVTAACLVVQRDRFLAVGGFDEREFAVAFNDVDLCMRLNQRGWQAFYEPRATLIHHESVSRGLDRDPVGARRFAGELAALRRNWGTDRLVDPFHHPELSPFSERFVIRLQVEQG